jgi:hypothetical protein
MQSFRNIYQISGWYADSFESRAAFFQRLETSAVPTQSELGGDAEEANLHNRRTVSFTGKVSAALVGAYKPHGKACSLEASEVKLPL